jgi:predicted ATPase
MPYALIYMGLTATSARWADETEEAANELVSLTREHGFSLFLGYGLLLQGGALTIRGRGEAAVERINESVAAMQATGIRRSDPMVLGFVAEALALKGDVAAGLQMLATASAAAEAAGAHWADAELHRLRGDVRSRLPPTGPRSRGVFAAHWRSRASRAAAGSSCAPRSVLPACCVPNSGRTRPAIFSAPYTTGSPKA